MISRITTNIKVPVIVWNKDGVCGSNLNLWTVLIVVYEPCHATNLHCRFVVSLLCLDNVHVLSKFLYMGLISLIYLIYYSIYIIYSYIIYIFSNIGNNLGLFKVVYTL